MESSIQMAELDDIDIFLRKSEVRKITGLSDTSIWRLERKKQFPQRRRISYSSVGWLRSEILAWIESRPIVKLKE